MIGKSRENDVNNGIAPPQDSGDVINEPFNSTRPFSMMIEPQHFEALPKTAGEMPADAIESALREVHASSLVFKHNVFKPTAREGVTINLDGHVAESGAVVVHRCRFLKKPRRKLTPRSAGVES